MSNHFNNELLFEIFHIYNMARQWLTLQALNSIIENAPHFK